nr:MAG TPA: endosialidase chaperone [Bacteriophage sp.]
MAHTAVRYITAHSEWHLLGVYTMVDYGLQDLFYAPNVDKQLIITTDDGSVTITNTELHQESFELTESLCSESELTFGACEAAAVKFTISNVFTSLKDKWITVKMVLNGDNSNPFIFGRYKVVSDKPTADRTKREIEAYDALYDVINADVVGWYNNILPNTETYVTLKQFRNNFFNYFGIVQKDITLANDDMTTSRTVDADELSGSQVLNAICEINGCLGHIGRTGQYEYVYLDSTSPITISKNHYISADYQDYMVAQIDKLQIRQDEDDIGSIVGTGSNTYVIENNFLVYGKDAAQLKTIATNAFNRIKSITYRPAEISSVGNPCIEVGDAIKLSTKYAELTTYVLERSLKGIQALTDSFTAQGEQLRTTQINSSNKSITQLKGRVNRLTHNVDQNKAEILNVEEGLKNEITQTASELEIKIQSLQSQIDGEITVINGHGVPTLYNYPAYNWTASPKTGDILVEGLKFTYSDEVYRKHQRTLFFDEDSITTYRFIKKDNVWTWEPIVDTEYSVIQKQIADLNVTTQGITQSVEQLSTKVTNDYITQIDAKTLVSTTADGIKEDISKTYTTRDYINTLSAEFNRTAEGLTAQISEVNEALDGANEVYTIQGTPTLRNYPAYNWTSGPVVGDKLTQGLRFTYSDVSYKKHNRALVYDEVAGKTYRFIKNGDTWGFSDVGNTEFSWVNKKLAEYKATVDGVSADLSKFETKVGSDYITKVDAQASINYSVEELSREFSKTYATQEALSDYSTTTQMNTAIAESAKGIKIEISKSYATQKTVDDMKTTLNATAEGLSAKVGKNELITEINASAEQVKIASSKLDLQGLVTISSLKESGQTVINADNITTGTINALAIDGCTITGSSVAFANDTGGWNTIINSAGWWMVGKNPATGEENALNTPAYFMDNSGFSSMYVGGLLRYRNEAEFLTGAYASGSGAYYSQRARWYNIALMANSTSDIRYKNDIQYLDDEENMEELFDSLLPAAFYYNKGTGYIETQRHLGFIAQDIEKAIANLRITNDMALFDHEDEKKLGVDKQELIALCVWQIQKLKARVKELETNIGGTT